MSVKRFDKKFGDDFIKQIPNDPGIYRVYDDAGVLFYVGKATSLRRRISQYRNASRKSEHARMRKVVAAGHRWEWETTRTHEEAELLEVKLIRELRPKFNLSAAFSHRYPYLGYRLDVASGWCWFVLTSQEDKLPDAYQFHGVWRSRAPAEECFNALESLLKILGTPARRSDIYSARSGLSGRLGRFDRAFAVRGLDPAWLDELSRLFQGESPEALATLAMTLLDSPLARKKSEWVEDQLKLIRGFYREEARPFHEARLSLGLKLWPVPQSQRDEITLLARQKREGRRVEAAPASV
jgi:excinuclease ABC subunit C